MNFFPVVVEHDGGAGMLTCFPFSADPSLGPVDPLDTLQQYTLLQEYTRQPNGFSPTVLKCRPDCSCTIRRMSA